MEVVDVLKGLPPELLYRTLKDYPESCSKVTLLQWMKDYKSGFNTSQWVLFKLASDSIYKKISLENSKIYFGLEDIDKSFNWINLTDPIFETFIRNVPQKKIKYLKVNVIGTNFNIFYLKVLFDNARFIEIDLYTFIKLPTKIQKKIIRKVHRLNINHCETLSKLFNGKPAEFQKPTKKIIRTVDTKNQYRRTVAQLRNRKIEPIGQLSASLVVNSLSESFQTLNLNKFQGFNEKVTLMDNPNSSIEDSLSLIENKGENIKLIHLHWCSPGLDGQDIFERFKLLAIKKNILIIFDFNANSQRLIHQSIPDGFKYLLNGTIDFSKQISQISNTRFNKLQCYNLSENFKNYEMLYNGVFNLSISGSKIDLSLALCKVFKNLKVLKLENTNLSNILIKCPKLTAVYLKKCQSTNDTFFNSISTLDLHTIEIDDGDLNINSLPITLKHFKLITDAISPYQLKHEYLIQIHKLHQLELLTITALHHWWVGLDLDLVRKLQMIQVYNSGNAFLGFQGSMERKLQGRRIKMEYL